jgi:hypothetical protein
LISPSAIKSSKKTFDSIRCSKPFVTKSTTYTMIDRLKGHAIFADEQAIDRLKMCDNCGGFAMTEIRDNPMAFGSIIVA